MKQTNKRKTITKTKQKTKNLHSQFQISFFPNKVFLSLGKPVGIKAHDPFFYISPVVIWDC